MGLRIRRIGPTVSSPGGVKGDLNQALVLLGLVLRMFVVFINCSLCLCLFTCL